MTMTPATIKTLMSLVGVLAGAAMLVPQLVPYQAALSALSAGLLAWAHGRRPGDEKSAPAVPTPDDDLPPTPRTGSGAPPMVALLIVVAFALSGTLPACASSPPPKGCTEQDAAKIAAICAARVQTECVDKGIAEADCKVIAECDAQADAYQKDCSR
jgi:hypothetical protein